MKKNSFYSIVILAALLLPAHQLLANIRLPALIADNMVLQQKTKIIVWGWADAGEMIEISNSWNHAVKKIKVSDNGNWQVPVVTGKAGGPYEIFIKGNNTVTIHNVFLGEVWLCSGQSNMEFPLAKKASWRTGVFNAEQEIAKAEYPLIRMFTVKQQVAGEPRKDVEGAWSVCSPATAGNFSAVAYYFAKEVHAATGYPVGLIHSSWGGTPAESWVSKEVLAADPDLSQVLKRYDDAVQKYQTDTSIKKKVNPLTDSKSPTKLYNAMIHPLVPYTIKGVIWYQGESNSMRAWQYRKLFPALINSWRREWNSELPFYFVQIAPEYQQSPEIREAQLLTLQSVPKTGMVVITDAGDSLNVHPRNKEVVGHRLALWALVKEYGKTLSYSGPVYKNMQIKNGHAIIRFNYAKDGLLAKEDMSKEFTIADADQKFVPAVVTIKGNTLVVSNPGIKEPVAVRFGWKNFPHAVLFSKAGLPVSPFRTDDWPGETYGKN